MGGLLDSAYSSFYSNIIISEFPHASETFPGGEDVNTLDSARIALVDARNILLKIRKEILDKAGNSPLRPQTTPHPQQEKKQNAWGHAIKKVVAGNAIKKAAAVEQFKRAGSLRKSKNLHTHNSEDPVFTANAASEGKKLFGSSLSRLEMLVDDTSHLNTASLPKSAKLTRFPSEQHSQDALTAPAPEEQVSMAMSGKLILARELSRSDSERMLIEEVSLTDMASSSHKTTAATKVKRNSRITR